MNHGRWRFDRASRKVSARPLLQDPRLPVVMSWSGGKDSALALWRLRQNPAFDVRALLTTITEGYDRISMHAIRESILRRQASEIGVPVVRVPIPPDCPDALYQQRMSEALDDPRIADVLHFAFGDLFLEDVRAYREIATCDGWQAGSLSALGRGHGRTRPFVHQRRFPCDLDLCRPSTDGCLLRRPLLRRVTPSRSTGRRGLVR